MNNRRRDNSPVWTTVETTAITTAEKEATATGEPRSLWDRVETHLRPQEDQNDELSKKFAARPAMPPGLHRTLLEAHLRLLLGKLGGAGRGGGGEGVRGGRGRGRGEGELARKPDRPCCASDAGSGGSGNGGSTIKNNNTSTSKSAPPTLPGTPYVPLQSERDRAVYEFISASGGSSGAVSTAIGTGDGNGTKERDGSRLQRGAGVAGGGRDSLEQKNGSRPGTGRGRPCSSRSARSAPECLESGRLLSVTVASIDTALVELQAAFEEEAQNLLEEVADLTGLLEDQAQRKTDAERRSRRHTSNTPVTETSTGSGGGGVGGGGGGGGAIPLSELRRYGKKLEEAVRSKEHAAEEPRGGCRCLGDSLKALSGIGNGSGSGGIGGDSSVGRGEKDGLGPSGTGAAAGGAAAAAGGGCEEKEEWGRGTLARKLRGAVRVSREEEKLDDERFWS
eukprot:jgi/Undpi1/2530/HiC_scaffold_13.g05909.m1